MSHVTYYNESRDIFLEIESFGILWIIGAARKTLHLFSFA